MLTTSTSQLVSVPNSTVEVPIRPYTAALGAPRFPAPACGSVGGDTDVLGDGIRREVRGGRADPLHARDVVGQRAEVDGSVEEHVDDREQQRRVGTRPRRDVPVGQLGGPGARRVDHHQSAAALAQRLSLPPKSAAV